MSAFEITQKWPNLTDTELLKMSDPNSRHLCATYGMARKDLIEMFSHMPWAEVIVCPDQYLFKHECQT